MVNNFEVKSQKGIGTIAILITIATFVIAGGTSYWYLGMYKPAKKYAAEILPVFDNFVSEVSQTFRPDVIQDNLDFEGARAMFEKRTIIIEKTAAELSDLRPPRRMKSIHNRFSGFLRGLEDSTTELKGRTFLIQDTVLWYRSLDPENRLSIEPPLPPWSPDDPVISIPELTIDAMLKKWSERLPKATTIAERWSKKNRCVPSPILDSPGAIFCTDDIMEKWETASRHVKEAIDFFRAQKLSFNPFTRRDSGGPLIAGNIQKMEELIGFTSGLNSIISDNHARALVDYQALRGLNKEQVELGDMMNNLRENN